METSDSIRLTQTVKKGGCAAKVAAEELRQILAQVKFPPAPPELLIHSDTFDDAAIYRVSSELALVQTLDFFTPIVDSPHLFGRIAAANAISDVYAMGGKPMTAMAIFAFPLATMENQIAVEVLQGASEVIQEAGASLVGGHTIDDETMKFGLSVTGFVHPDRVWSNAGAKPGDVLILTKPIGTGTLTAALKSGEADEAQIRDGLESMATLNNVPDFLSAQLQLAIHAATDVTGFGLAGHAFNMAKASDVTLAINLSDVPRFEKTMEYLDRGFLTKAHRTNREYTASHFEFAPSEGSSNGDLLQKLVFDPQTNGGLLLAVSEDAADEVIRCLSGRFHAAKKIGQVTEKQSTALKFK